MRHPILEVATVPTRGIDGVTYTSSADPTHAHAHDAVENGKDWACVYSNDGEYLLFRAWRVSPTAYAWQTPAMPSPAFGTLESAS